jgi:hypothetical protein
VIAIIGVIVLLLIGDGIYAGRGIRDSLTTMSREVNDGRSALERGDLASARSSFERASIAARDARSLAAHPSVWIARFLPSFGRDAEAALALVSAGSLITEAGLDAVRAGEALGGTDAESLGRALLRDGIVQIDAVERGTPFIERAHRHLQEAAEVIRIRDTANIDELADAVVTARRRIDLALDTSSSALRLLEVLPGLLGDEGDKRYLLAFQSPSEARGTGGIIGLYGVLEASGGRISLTTVGPFAALFTEQTIARLERLASFEGPVGDKDPLDLTTEVNLSPDFPHVAKALLAIYRSSTGRSLDGVLAVDPVALQELIKGTGPLAVDGLTLGPENTSRYLLRDAYLDRDPESQTRLLIGVIQQFYGRLGGGEVDGPALITAFGDVSGSQHLKLYSATPSEQRRLVELGISGDLRSYGENTQMVFHNNDGANKVDFYLRRSMETTIDIARDGTAVVTNDIRLTNTAPSGVENPLLRSYDNAAPVGVNRMVLHCVVAREAVAVSWKVDGRRVPVTSRFVAGLRNIASKLEIPPGETSNVTVTYEIPAAISVLTGGSFDFALVPQATVSPDNFTLRFVPPEGFLVTTDGGKAVGSGTVEFSGELDSPRSYRIRVEPL